MNTEIKFEKIHRVRLPFDMRSKDPKKDCGIHGLDVWFILSGPKGATQFMFSVNAYLPHVVTRQTHGDAGLYSGYDVGYHSTYPMFEGQEQSDCDILPGGKCYHDGSSLYAADKCKEFFSIKGERIDPHVWKFLEEEYMRTFEGKNDSTSTTI